MLQLGSRFAPGRDSHVRRKRSFGLGMPLDSMVGESRMPAIFRVASRHVAADAVAVLAGMGRGEISRVAGEAPGAEKTHGFERLVVRIVAGSAPQAPVALARAGASGELLHVADDLELLGVGALRRDVTVSREDIFQALSGLKVAKLLPWIQNSAHAQQMALFANAVASARLQLRRVDDRGSPGVAQMPLRRAVAALASDRFRRKHGRPILVR